MDFILIDYSEVYYRTICKTEVPSKRGGKFIQIRNEKEEYLVLSPAGLSSFHANIAERFCLVQGIEGRYTTPRTDVYEILDPDWSIIGGGKWVMNDRERWLRLFGESQAYRRFDAIGLKDRLLASKGLFRYDVTIIA